MRILIVDDEMPVLAKMKVMLSAYGECVLASNAQHALQLFTAAAQKGTPFHLITIDINLDGTNGIDLLEAMIRLENQQAQPIAKKIMVSASGTKDNLIRARIKGCDGFMVKPVKRDTLIEKMTSLGYCPAPPTAKPVDAESGSDSPQANSVGESTAPTA